jgi:hypothetical protein
MYSHRPSTSKKVLLLKTELIIPGMNEIHSTGDPISMALII